MIIRKVVEKDLDGKLVEIQGIDTKESKDIILAHDGNIVFQMEKKAFYEMLKEALQLHNESG